MTSLWLVLTLLVAAPSPKALTWAPAADALAHGHWREADARASRYLGQSGPKPHDDDTATAELIAAMARLHGAPPDQALEAITRLRGLGIDLGAQGTAMRAHLQSLTDACHQALCEAQSLPKTSMWHLAAWSDVATCMLRHNPTLPLHSPTPAGIAQIEAELIAAAGRSHDGLAAAQALGLAANLSEAWDDPAQAAKLYGQIAQTFGHLDAGSRARAALRRLHRAGLIAPGAIPIRLEIDPAARASLWPSPQGRAALRKQAQRIQRASGRRSEAYADAAMDLVELALVAQAYADAEHALDAVLHKPWALPKKSQPRAWLLAGDIAALRGKAAVAQASWRHAMAASDTDPHAVVAGVHLAGWLAAHGSYEAANRLGAQMAARLPLGRELVLVRDDGAPQQIDTNAVQIEITRIARLDAIHVPKPANWAQLAIAVTDPQANLALGPAAAHATSPEAVSQDGVRGADARLQDLVRQDEAALPADGAAVLSDTAAIEVLIRHHLPKEARALLRQVPARDLTNGQRISVADLYSRLGDTHKATVLMSRCSTCDGVSAAAAALAYPRPYPREVARAARQNHIPQALIYAIMHEESAFDPQAESPRGALGLMQLMPSTADSLNHGSPRRSRAHGALLRPAVSIELGALYLGRLYKQFDGNIAAVAAAYQAGAPRAQRWLHLAQQLGVPEQLGLVIPLVSTREYVRHVQRNMQGYGHIGLAL